jgi:hypothetical protein
MFVLFNENKKFIGYSPDIPDNSNLIKIQIPDSQSDLSMWKWEGDYDGKMVPIDIGYPVEEIQLEKDLFEFISKKYPINIQIINIIKQLRKIVNSNDALEDEDFVDMSDIIINALDKHNKRINYYRNHSKFITKYESEQQFKETFGK